jgi:hypothetical protein
MAARDMCAVRGCMELAPGVLLFTLRSVDHAAAVVRLPPTLPHTSDGRAVGRRDGAGAVAAAQRHAAAAGVGQSAAHRGHGPAERRLWCVLRVCLCDELG